MIHGVLPYLKKHATPKQYVRYDTILTVHTHEAAKEIKEDFCHATKKKFLTNMLVSILSLIILFSYLYETATRLLLFIFPVPRGRTSRTYMYDVDLAMLHKDLITSLNTLCLHLPLHSLRQHGQ